MSTDRLTSLKIIYLHLFLSSKLLQKGPKAPISMNISFISVVL